MAVRTVAVRATPACAAAATLTASAEAEARGTTLAAGTEAVPPPPGLLFCLRAHPRALCGFVCVHVVLLDGR
jgi:hypothetical protein